MTYIADLKSETQELIKLFTFGPQIAGQVNMIAGVQDILDAKTGVAVVIQKTGSGLNTKYQLIPYQAVDLTVIPQYNSEYAALEDLTTVLNNRTQDGKESLVENLKAASLPMEQLNVVATILKEHGIDIDATAVTGSGSGATKTTVVVPGIDAAPAGAAQPSLQDMLKQFGK